VALGNTGNSEDLPALIKAAQDPEQLIAEHANWAMAEIAKRSAFNILKRFVQRERNHDAKRR
jgi:hypothetical protein